LGGHHRSTPNPARIELLASVVAPAIVCTASFNGPPIGVPNSRNATTMPPANRPHLIFFRARNSTPMTMTISTVYEIMKEPPGQTAAPAAAEDAADEGPSGPAWPVAQQS